MPAGSTPRPGGAVSVKVEPATFEDGIRGLGFYPRASYLHKPEGKLKNSTVLSAIKMLAGRTFLVAAPSRCKLRSAS